MCVRYGSPIERDACASLLYLIIIRYLGNLYMFSVLFVLSFLWTHCGLK